MRRRQSPGPQCFTAMRVAGTRSQLTLLRSSWRVRRELGVDEADGCSVHEVSILRQPKDFANVRSESEACSAFDANHGHGGHLSEEAYDDTWRWAQDISVPTSRRENYASESCVEHGHYLHSDGSWLPLSDSSYRLVQSICPVVATFEHSRRFVLLRGSRGRSFSGKSADFQHRPRQPIHKPRLHFTSPESPSRDQHGRPRSRDRQRLCRAAMAYGEIRGGVSERVRERQGGRGIARDILQILLRGTHPPIARVQDSGSNLSCRMTGPENQSIASSIFSCRHGSTWRSLSIRDAIYVSGVGYRCTTGPKSPSGDRHNLPDLNKAKLGGDDRARTMRPVDAFAANIRNQADRTHQDALGARGRSTNAKWMGWSELQSAYGLLSLPHY